MEPVESYQRQCDWSEGWDAAERQFKESVNIGQAVIIRSFEDRLDTMAEEYEDLLKDAANTISNQQMVIRELKQYIDDINTPTEGFKY